MASPDLISEVFEFTSKHFPHLEIGVHLHTRPGDWFSKMNAAYTSGCRKFDGALLGFGGCPMAKDELVGNMPMEHMITFAEEIANSRLVDPDKLKEALNMAKNLYAPQ
jgi:hydroxymethylglutaryl-CoA lyase